MLGYIVGAQTALHHGLYYVRNCHQQLWRRLSFPTGPIVEAPIPDPDPSALYRVP